MNVIEQRRHVIGFFHQAMARFQGEALNIIILKGEDYATEEVSMPEVFFAAAELNVTAPQILWVQVRKHMSAVAHYLHRGSLHSEDVRSRLMDIANYMGLIDSYIVSPPVWLDNLMYLVTTEQFPNRTPEEVIQLKNWIHIQRLANTHRIVPVTHPALPFEDTPVRVRFET